MAQAVNRYFSSDSRVYGRRTPTSQTINHLSPVAPTVSVDVFTAFKIYLKKQSSSQGKQRVIVGQMLRRCLAVRIAAQHAVDGLCCVDVLVLRDLGILNQF